MPRLVASLAWLLACSSVAYACGGAPVGPASHPTPVEPDAGSAATAEAAKPQASASAEPPAPAVVAQDLTVGAGETAAAGDHVTVHYVGTLTDGTEFDSSRKRSHPFEFVLGQGQVIKGWDEGVVGMKVGGRRKLTIPPALGYGPRGQPPSIPGNSTLLFDVELVEIEK